MDEDQVLAEIRKLTIDDNLPIESILKKIITISSKYLYTNDKKVSRNKNIIMGNILSLLRSKGATYTIDVGTRYDILDNRVGPYPYDSFIFYAERGYNASWECILISESVVLSIDNINIDALTKEMISNVDIKYGMLYCHNTTFRMRESLYIIPSRSFIRFNSNGIYVARGSKEMQIPISNSDILALPSYILDWLYPSVKQEVSLDDLLQ